MLVDSVAAARERTGVPDVAAALHVDGRTSLAGSAERPFRIASVTKSFTATLCFEAGPWDDRTRALLSHTAGYRPEAAEPLPESCAGLWSYSNAGYWEAAARFDDYSAANTSETGLSLAYRYLGKQRRAAMLTHPIDPTLEPNGVVLRAGSYVSPFFVEEEEEEKQAKDKKDDEKKDDPKKKDGKQKPKKKEAKPDPRKRVNPLPGNVAECAIHQPLAFEPALAREGDAFDHHREVRFAAAVVARMAVVAGAVVDHVEPRRHEGMAQQGFDLAGDTSCHFGAFLKR